ncbi:MAG: EAL domain-containing protein [Bauldia sp.]
MRRIVFSALTGLFLVVIAAAVAFAAGRLLALDMSATIAIGVGVLSALSIVQVNLRRVRDEALLDRRLADLGMIEGRAAANLQALAARVATVEEDLKEAGSGDSEPILAEVELLSALVRDLAESVAAVEQKVTGVAPPPVKLPPATPLAERVQERAAARAAEPSTAAAPPAKTLKPEFLQEVQAAVDGSRVEIHLQPVVTLPQRRPRYYEALARLRNSDGGLIAPSDFIPAAESLQLMPRIDNLVLFRAVQIERRLAARQREAGIFINIAGESLRDADFTAEFVSFMTANKALAGSLVFEFTQSTVDSMGPLEQESLAALAEIGFRFSMDHVSDLKVDFQRLAGRGFRFVKVAASTLLRRSARGSPDIAYPDLSDMLARFNIDLVADRIESESEVVDLLDYDIRLGQGYLFAPPRPVKLDTASSAADKAMPLPTGSARAAATPAAAAAPKTDVAMAKIRASLMR